MTTHENEPLCEKGYYKSIKSSIERNFEGVYGNFIVSVDYIYTKQLSKTICTTRLVVNRTKIVDLLEKLYTIYDNFHLNYIIMMHQSYLDANEITFITTEINKYMMKSFQTFDEQFIYNRIMINSELIMLRQLFKVRKLNHINLKWLFVNDNIYRDFIKYK